VSITAIVEGNSIRLPPGTNLPDGTRVRIELPGGSVPPGDDLSALIGSWQEDAEFDAAVQAFAQVDETLWR
jgi:hypothetical protein